MTKAQKEILRIVQGNKHITADEVYTQAKKAITNIALGTVYRNLNAFAENGIIRRIQRGDAPDFYDGNTSPHGHVVCISCGKVNDLIMPGLEEYAKKHSQIKIIKLELLAHCVCAECGGHGNEV